jgi:hypothetical protein
MGSAEGMAALPLHAGSPRKVTLSRAPSRRSGKVDAGPAQGETHYNLVFHRHLVHKIAVEHLFIGEMNAKNVARQTIRS